MTLNILSVDDSKAVRIIIKKAFATYDVNIAEAANGVEGLAAAEKTNPDIILLDVTMPVMDGVEMLTKLKSDSNLKQIPVIMLTAEAGRENVMKIAKLGIRDYIVKPFEEASLIEKVSRVIDIRPRDETGGKQKTISDSCDILVVEDKPAIITQIKDGLSHTPWEVHGVKTQGETIDFCQSKIPDVIIISLSLPDDAAISTFRGLRSQAKTKYIPTFGLAVKTALDEQKNAQDSGFNYIITKPINFEDLETKIAKAINLDTSERYFSTQEDFLQISIPPKCSPSMLKEITTYQADKVSEAVDNGLTRVIFDISQMETFDTDTMRLLMDTMKMCRELTLNLAFVGNDIMRTESQKFEESKSWVFHNSLDEAKAAPLQSVG